MYIYINKWQRNICYPVKSQFMETYCIWERITQTAIKTTRLAIVMQQHNFSTANGIVKISLLIMTNFYKHWADIRIGFF